MDTKKFKNYFSLEQLKENDGSNGKPFWILLDGKVYDVSYYDHPGGIEVYRQEDPDNYEDFYDKFESIGHSPAALKLMKKLYIGDLKQD
jgi:cytochrome b involved in lipid metabolism